MGGRRLGLDLTSASATRAAGHEGLSDLSLLPVDGIQRHPVYFDIAGVPDITQVPRRLWARTGCGLGPSSSWWVPTRESAECSFARSPGAGAERPAPPVRAVYADLAGPRRLRSGNQKGIHPR